MRVVEDFKEFMLWRQRHYNLLRLRKVIAAIDDGLYQDPRVQQGAAILTSALANAMTREASHAGR